MDLLLKHVIKKFEEDLLRDHVKKSASGYSSKVGKLLASYMNETGSKRWKPTANNASWHEYACHQYRRRNS